MNTNSPVRDAEFQKMLEDERARCEQHKKHYTLLKIENQTLQEECVDLQDKMRQILRECKEVKEASEKSVEMASKALNHKQTEIENLQKMMASNSPAVLRHSIKKELECVIDNEMKELEEDLEKTRFNHQQLRYDNALLKTQIESLELTNRRALQELKMRHELEIRTLNEAKDQLTRELSLATSPLEDKRLKVLQKENNQLQAKVRSLSNEIEEITEQKEILKQEAESVSRNITKQIMEHSMAIRDLESEKMNLSMHKNSLQNKLAKIKEENVKLASQAQNYKSEMLKLRDIHQKCLHQHDVEISEARIENAHLKAETEKDIEKARAKLSCSELSLEMIKENYEKLETTSKERETSYRSAIQTYRNQEKEYKQKIYDFETALKNLSETKTSLASELKLKETQLDNSLKQLKEIESKTEREANQLRIANQKIAELKNQLEQSKLDVQLLNEQLIKEQYKVSEGEKLEKELRQQRERLKEMAAKMGEELEKNKDQIIKERDAMETLLNDKKSQWEQERNYLITKIEKVEKQIINDNVSHRNEISEYKEKMAQLSKTVSKLKLKVEQLVKERKDLEKNVPFKVHESLQHQFEDFQRRHQEFKTILLSNPLPISNNL